VWKWIVYLLKIEALFHILYFLVGSKIKMLFLEWVLLVLPSLVLSAADFVIEPEYERVSCGSGIKLSHVPSGYRLHSHGINYGSGSGQQSVTGFEEGNDPK
jgi:dolichyl-phosphate-mannose--protein O-mannosyl transferase